MRRPFRTAAIVLSTLVATPAVMAAPIPILTNVASAHEIELKSGTCLSPTSAEFHFSASNMGDGARTVTVTAPDGTSGSATRDADGSFTVTVSGFPAQTGNVKFTWSTDAVMKGEPTTYVNFSKCQPPPPPEHVTPPNLGGEIKCKAGVDGKSEYTLKLSGELDKFTGGITLDGLPATDGQTVNNEQHTLVGTYPDGTYGNQTVTVTVGPTSPCDVQVGLPPVPPTPVVPPVVVPPVTPVVEVVKKLTTTVADCVLEFRITNNGNVRTNHEGFNDVGYWINGGPPILANIEPGQTLVVPLKVGDMLGFNPGTWEHTGPLSHVAAECTTSTTNSGTRALPATE